MPDRSSVRVVAKVSRVGIPGLDPKTGWPDGEGVASAVIGTDRRVPGDIHIDVGALADHESRLAVKLSELWRDGAVDVFIDGQAITSATELTSVGPIAGLVHPSEVYVTPHGNFQGLTGTWTEFYNDTTHLYRVERTAGAATDTVVLDVPGFLLRQGADSGRKPTGFKLVYSVDTDDLDDVALEVFRTLSPADGAAPTAETLSTGQTFDSDHDTAAERGDSTGAPEQHTLVATFGDTLDAVDWLNDGEGVHAEVTVDSSSSATAEFTLWSWALLFDERLTVPVE